MAVGGVWGGQGVWGVLQCQGPTSNHGENQAHETPEFHAGVITSSGHGGYF